MNGWIVSAGRIGAAGYLGICLLLFFRQSRYVYYPSKRVTLTPAQLGMAFEPLRIGTADGETLAAWFVPAAAGEEASGSGDGPLTVLFCHGNAGNIGDRLGTVRVFHRLGFDVLLFDYRGYGESTGTPSEKGTYQDALAAWNYLVETRKVAPDRIVVFGRSLGGAVAAWLAEHHPPRVLVLESTFTSAPAMAHRMFPYLPTRLLVRFRYDTLSRMPKIACPVLVAHSPEDDLIPYAMGRRLYAAAREPKAFEILVGGHNAGGLDILPAYQQRLKRFCETRGGRNPAPDGAR